MNADLRGKEPRCKALGRMGLALIRREHCRIPGGGWEKEH